MPGPFEGIRVVEFGRFIAAPYCGQLLADGGADVIKVEPIDGDETRRNGPIFPGEGRQFLNKNRGKRSLAADLHDPAVAAAVRSLAASADVVVANFRPGQSEALGLDYESLARANPRIIYAENTAYGRYGPMAGVAGMDIVVGAYAGLVNLAEDGPRPLSDPIIDYTAGVLLAWGISTALYARERTGRGQRLDVSLLHTALVLQNNHVNHVDCLDDWRTEFVDYLREAFARGETWADVLARREELQPHVLAGAYYGYLPAADGTIAVAAMARPLRLKMMEVVGFDDRWTREPGWLPDDARAYARDLQGVVEARLRLHPASYWCERLTAAGVPCGPVRLREQLLEDEQVRANGLTVRLEHELVGGVTVVAPPVVFSATPLVAAAPSPLLGQHTAEILREAGLDDAGIAELRASGAVRLP